MATLKKIAHAPSPSVYIVSERQSYYPNAHFSVSIGSETADEAKKRLKKQCTGAPDLPESMPVDPVEPRAQLSNSKVPSNSPAANVAATSESRANE